MSESTNLPPQNTHIAYGIRVQQPAPPKSLPHPCYYGYISYVKSTQLILQIIQNFTSICTIYSPEN